MKTGAYWKKTTSKISFIEKKTMEMKTKEKRKIFMLKTVNWHFTQWRRQLYKVQPSNHILSGNPYIYFLIDQR